MSNPKSHSSSKRTKKPSLTIVAPCYNEEDCFPFSLKVLSDLLIREIEDDCISSDSRLLFIDDGSTDKTWSLIAEAAELSPYVHGLKLSRNCGHQVALLAGLKAVDTEISISIDIDLQDDISVIPEMISKYIEGDEIIYGVRNDRSTDSFFKKNTASIYYALMSKLVPNLIPHHADFRLLGPRALEALRSYNVKNLYLRGIIPELGFRSSVIGYKRLERKAGQTHYPFLKMMQLAWRGITSQTLLPLRLITFLGTVALILALVGFGYTLYSWIYLNVAAGWTSLETTIIFFGSIQLFSIGVVGEYLAKTQAEVVDKPLYFIEDYL